MGLADLFRPKYRHSNVDVRTEAVRALSSDDITILTQVAKTDRDIKVRRIAMEKIDEADVLADIAAAETERSLRDFAGARAAELWAQLACGDDAEAAAAALGGIIKLGDQDVLVDVAVRAALPASRKRAFGELRDPRALADLAKSDAPQDVRAAAVARIDDGDVLRALAIDTTSKEVGLAAVDKLDDADRLENVAQKAKNKAVRQRARKIVTEMAEAERAAKPGVADDVKRRRAERAQLLREIEAHAESYEFGKTAELVAAAETAWVAAASDADADAKARFEKAVTRFRKRRELHEQTARSTDELRAIEREAAAAKARRAEQDTKPALKVTEPGDKPDKDNDKDDKDDYVRPAAAAAPDPAREAREAEAKVRREERAAQEQDRQARKAAEAAERELRKKDDAERAVAIAASMTAMCEDLEKLAESKDGREIERTLQQAGRAAEQIGKLPPEQRDALGDRYVAARGKLVIKVQELREAQDWARFANVPKAEALIATAKAMAAEEPSSDLGNRLRQLQALWKEAGPLPQKRGKELWDTFKADCDAVYEKVRGVRAVETEKFAEVAKEKDALIAEAEGLAESSDWVETAAKLKALQTKWKESGHLPRKQGDELWTRFRAACDKFFERRKPVLDAANAEETANLAAKQALIARARAVADGAPGDGGWGKAIGAIKDVQLAWKEIGYVPRRDADRVWREFRAACDAVFAKRDAARDGEANAHRAEIDATRAAIDAVMAGGDDVVARALAARGKAQALGVFAGEVEAMVRYVVTSHATAVAGTELDPAAARARRGKLIARAEALLPKVVTSEDPTLDVAARLKKAMSKNAFGDLRWDGRDPAEVIEELRAEWREAGPLFDDADRAQQDQFDGVAARVLVAAGVGAGAGSSAKPAAPVKPGVELAPPPSPQPATVLSAHDAVTQPVAFPAAAVAAPAAAAPAVAEPMAPPPPDARARPLSAPPPMDELDGGWDLGEEDPTAGATPTAELPAPPSATEMAGDGATGGDGITDDSGWD